MASYAETAERYRDELFRNRSESCSREQAYVYINDARPDIKGLAAGVLAGVATDIDALIAAVSTAPGMSELDTDPGLLSATQTVWPTVAAARYPQA